jgi:thiol-disulfide isomerase/thioredoxin
MKKTIPFLVLSFCFLITRLIGQDEFTVPLTRTVDPAFYSKLKGKSVINLYDLNKQCLSSVKNNIHFPSLNFVPTDTAYGEITRQSTRISTFKNQYYILVFNYRSATPIVYTSDSYDFTTAVNATLSPGKVLKMQVTTAMNGTINYFLQKDTTKFAKVPISVYGQNEEACEHIEGRYALRLHTDCAKAGDVERKRNKFSITVYDANADGIFNQPGVDKLFLGGVGDEYAVLSFTEKDALNAAFQKEQMIIETGKQKFKVTHIDKQGTSVTLVPYQGAAPIALKQFVDIPDLKVKLASGDSLLLTSLEHQKKYIYLHVWWESCPPCIRDIPVLDSIGEKYKSKLIIAGLLDRSNLIDLNELIKRYSIKNLQALSTSEVNVNLAQNGYPYGVLFSENGELIKADVDKKQLLEFLEKH